MELKKRGNKMNWYLVQYGDSSGMVYQWAQADNHLDAAADVLVDRGSSGMVANDAPDEYQSIIVVRKDDCIAGSYTMREVESRANCMLGLSDEQWLPWADDEDSYE